MTTATGLASTFGPTGGRLSRSGRSSCWLEGIDDPPQELLQGGGGRWRQWPRRSRGVDAAADGEDLSVVSTLLDPVPFGDLRLQHSSFRQQAGDVREVLATLGVRYAFTTALPRLSMATVMTALPCSSRSVIILMRRLHMNEVQLFKYHHSTPWTKGLTIRTSQVQRPPLVFVDSGAC